MKTRTPLLAAALLSLALAATGCGPLADDGGSDGGNTDGGSSDNPAPAALIAEAKDAAEAAMEAGEAARTILEVLGILPVYDCGEPRRTFVGRIASDYEAQVACATATAQPAGADGDEIILDFGSGCSVEGHQLAGQVVFAYSGGESRLDLALDVSALSVDGQTLDAAGGYGTCSDETRYWASVTGAVPGQSGLTFDLDAQVASRSGPPIIGGTTLLIDGTGSLTRTSGTDTVSFTALEYEMGERFPKTGTILITTASGHTVRIVFAEVRWSLGEAEITVDDYDPVTVPLLR